MKKLNTSLITSGVGYPPSKKGWDFLMQSYTETIAEIAKGMYAETYAVNTPYVLYGCVKSTSGSPFSYTAGAIFYNGEVYSFPAVASIAIATSDICTITTTNDPTADPTTMTDGSIVNIHNIRAVVLSDAAAVTNGATQFNFSSCIFLQGGWHNIGGTGEPAFQNSWANAGTVLGIAVNDARFTKEGKWVKLSGIITGGANNTVAFTLPTGYRPSKMIYQINSGTTSLVDRYLYIKTDGTVTVVDSTAGTNYAFLDGIQFPID
jgi:hypothetical protein